jgi:hypothetical protein
VDRDKRVPLALRVLKDLLVLLALLDLKVTKVK